MINRKVNFIKLGVLLFGIPLLLWNCEKEEFINQPSNITESNISLRHITAKQIPEITNDLKSKLVFAKNSNSSLDINYDYILEVSDSLNNKTFSFKTNQGLENNYFVNIVINSSDSIISEPLVYKYIPTEQFFLEYINSIKPFSEFQGKIEIYTIDNFLQSTKSKNYQNRTLDGAPCNTIPVNDTNLGDIYNNNDGGGSEYYNCEVVRRTEACWCEGDLVGVHDHEATVVVYEINCQRDYTKIGTNNNTLCGGSNSSNNGPSSVGVNEPIIEICDDTDCTCPNGYKKNANGDCVKETNCEKLNRLVNNDDTNIKQALQNLKNNINTNGENGTEFTNNIITGFDSANLAPTNTNQISFAIGKEMYAAAHTHPPKATYPMFSFDDVLLLFNIYRTSRSDLKPNATLFLVSKETSNSQANVYAITFKDINTFGTKLTKEINAIGNDNPDANINQTTAQKVALLRQSYEKEERKNETGISGTLASNEQTFLKFFKEYGIALHKATDSNISNWAELSEGSLNPITTPCN